MLSSGLGVARIALRAYVRVMCIAVCTCVAEFPGRSKHTFSFYSVGMLVILFCLLK